MQILREQSDTIVITWESELGNPTIDLFNGEVIATICVKIKNPIRRDLIIDMLDPLQSGGASIFDSKLQFFDACFIDGGIRTGCSVPSFDLGFEIVDGYIAGCLNYTFGSEFEIYGDAFALWNDYPITAYLFKKNQLLEQHTFDSVSSEPYFFTLDSDEHMFLFVNEEGCFVQRNIQLTPNQVSYDIALDEQENTCYGMENGSYSFVISFDRSDTINNPTTFEVIWSTGKRGTFMTSEDPFESDILRLENLSVGDYDVMISNGECSLQRSFRIEDNTAFSAQPIITNPSCGESDGSIDLNIQPDGDYFIQWPSLNLDNQEIVSGLREGIYDFRVTNNKTGCEVSRTISLTEANIIAKIESVDTAECNLLGQFILTAYDNTGLDINISLDNGFSTQGYDTILIEGLEGGDYKIRLDNGSCIVDSLSVHIPQKTIEEIDIGDFEPIVSICPNESFDLPISDLSSDETLEVLYLLNSYFQGDTLQVAEGLHELELLTSRSCGKVVELEIMTLDVESKLPDTVFLQSDQLFDFTSELDENEEIIWTDGSFVTCDNFSCLIGRFTNVESQYISYEISNNLGCQISALVYVVIPEVERDLSFDFYVPNAIRLDSRDNSELCIYYSSDVVEVNYVRLYDRWGNVFLILSVH